MTSLRKDQICNLLKGIETGDVKSVTVVNEDKYIQHNPQTHEGSEGFRIGVHSAFYDLFRVSKSRLVEHWNTIEAIPPRSEWKNDNGKF